MQVTDQAHLERLPDGTIIRWLRIPGDETSEAVAFVRVEWVEPAGPYDPQIPGERPVIWVSPGGWQPMSIDEAGITYPVQIIHMPPIKGADGLPLGTPPPGGWQWPDDGPQLDPSRSELPWPQGENGLITGKDPYGFIDGPHGVQVGTLISGGTWPREKALECAALLYQAKPPANKYRVLDMADTFVAWLTENIETGE